MFYTLWLKKSFPARKKIDGPRHEESRLIAWARPAGIINLPLLSLNSFPIPLPAAPANSIIALH